MKENRKKKIIGIDARFYGPKSKGLGRYVQCVIERLKDCNKGDTDVEFVIFLGKEGWSDFKTSRNFKKVIANYRCYGFLEQFLFPLKILRNEIDLMYFPHFNIPVFCPAPFVVTIHDLILQHFPTRKSNSLLSKLIYKIKELGYSFVIRRVIKKAKKIIAVSNHTKKDLIDLLGAQNQKIEVVYEGVITGRKIIKKNKYEVSRFGISKPYLLYVGNAYPHKNLERLLGAFDRLDKKKYQLVLVGETFYFYDLLKNNTQNFSFLKNEVVFTGFVKDRDLVLLYRNASLYVFPSLYEGFGLPPLEAMVYGVPVVSSRATCLPEILGEAAVYFNPLNVLEMTEKMKMVLEDERLQADLRQAGLLRVEKYSWNKCSGRIMEILREELGKTP